MFIIITHKAAVQTSQGGRGTCLNIYRGSLAGGGWQGAVVKCNGDNMASHSSSSALPPPPISVQKLMNVGPPN